MLLSPASDKDGRNTRRRTGKTLWLVVATPNSRKHIRIASDCTSAVDAYMRLVLYSHATILRILSIRQPSKCLSCVKFFWIIQRHLAQRT